MIRVDFSKASERDLREIANYIERDNPRRAITFVRELRERCKSIGQFPKAARMIRVHAHELRLLPFRRYIIVYRIDSERVTVERIWHGARDISTLLDNTFAKDQL
jgi:toxin ParE1/3/4